MADVVGIWDGLEAVFDEVVAFEGFEDTDSLGGIL